MDDVYLKNQMNQNSINYKKSLDRIIDKYSKLQHSDGITVDVDKIHPRTLCRYMQQSRIELSRLKSKSLTDLTEESIKAQDITGNSELDLQQDGMADDTCVSFNQFSGDDSGMSRSDTTQLTVSSLNESRTNGSETELQPEDEDKDLEMTLSRHGSFVELYPSMISRIEKARHRQNVSEAADSVMRRYRRWRQNSSRSNLNSTFIVPQTHTSSHSKNVTNKENSNNQKKRQFTRTQPVPHQPTSLQSLQVQRPFPKRETHSPRRQQHQPILVMDFSGASDTSLLRESLNDTFTVSEMSKLKEEPCSYSTSPSRPGYLNAKALLDMSPRSKRFCAPSQQAVGCCRCASETSAVRERPDAYGSPVRQSPLQARMMTSLNTSPRVLSKSPRKHCVESFSREPMRPRSISTSLSSPPRKHFVPLREDSHLSLQLQLRSPRSATGAGHLRRHLSFDSSLPSISASYSPKKLDEDFMKAYHKFVCQNKLSFFNSHPCRLCARSSEASRGHSSSALAALALSPHRSVLRKRHRAVGGDEDPRSKRSRDNCCTSSPGSSRHRIEMLRRCHSPAKLSCDDLPYSSSAHRAFNEFRRQQQEQQRWESADAHQEAWMKRGRPLSAAEFSDLGGSLESRMAHGYSPRKWW